jgi:hypothetical protein
MIGCVDKVGGTGLVEEEAEDTGETETEDTGEEEEELFMEIGVEWTATGIDLNITNGDESGYWFGLAEDGAEGWTGEDCYLGYTLTDGSVLAYCHPADVDGVSLGYGGGTSDLQEGVETVFVDDAAKDSVTYYLEDVATATCWVWGANPSYYAGLGCEEI